MNADSIWAHTVVEALQRIYPHPLSHFICDWRLQSMTIALRSRRFKKRRGACGLGRPLSQYRILHAHTRHHHNVNRRALGWFEVLAKVLSQF